MDSHRTSDLTYGNLGTSVYDSERKCWRFSREPGRRTVLQYLGHHDVLVPPGKHFDGPSRGAEYGIQRLLKSHPEIVPGTGLLPPLARVSEAVTRVTSSYDPAIGNRLVLGAAQDLDAKRYKVGEIPIVATVVGQASDTVRLFSLEERRLAWEEFGVHQTVRLSVPHLDSREGSAWRGNHGPVQGLRFACKEGRPAFWLAVRQLDSTTILRPLKSRSPLGTASKANPKSQSFSNIDPNPVLTLPVSRTGAASHADVTFNPWYHRQVGILDQRGHWSIWDIEGHRVGGATYKAKLASSGFVDESLSGSERSNEDGWGSICWAGDLYTLFVFTRKHMAIWSLQSNPAHRLQGPNLGIEGTSAWILDVQQSPVNDNHLFLVTSSQVFWLEAIGTDRAETSQVAPACKTLLSWRHSRHEQDTSLQLSVLGRHGCASLLLFSRLSGLTTVFQFGLSSDDITMPFSISDPYRLEFPLGFVGMEQDAPSPHHERPKRNISSLLMLPARYVTKASNEPTGPGLMYQKNEVEFYSLLLLGNDLSLHASLYTSGVPRGGWKGQNSRRFEPVKRPNVVVADIRPRGRRRELVTDDRFVVEDGLLSSSEVEGQAEGSWRKKTGAGAHLNGDAEIWTLPWEWLYKMAFLEEDEQSPEVQDAGQTADSRSQGRPSANLSRLEERVIAKGTNGHRPIETLLELLGESSVGIDLDAASSSLSDLMWSLAERKTNSDEGGATAWKPVLRQLAWPPLLYNSTNDGEASQIFADDSLSRIYRRIYQDWLDPIRAKVSAGYLAANDRIARSVAVDLYLASVGVTLVPIDESGTPLASSANGARSTQARDPAREKQKQLTVASSPFQRLAYRPAPSRSQSSTFNATLLSQTPPPTDLPSGVTRQRDEDEDDEEEGPLSRLRAYSSITPQAHRAQPAVISNLLRHWTLGADPADYSWEASLHSTNVDQDEPGQSSNMSSHPSSSSSAVRKRRRPPEPSGLDSFPRQQRERAGQMPQGSQPVFYSSQLHLHRDEDAVRRGGGRTPGILVSQAGGISRAGGFSQARGEVKAAGGAMRIRNGDLEERALSKEQGQGDAQDKDEEDIPMTQTEPGAFGSRRFTHGHHVSSSGGGGVAGAGASASAGAGAGTGNAGMKRKGKRRAAGF